MIASRKATASKIGALGLVCLALAGCTRGRDDADILPPPGYREPAFAPIVKQPPRSKRPHLAAGFYEREVDSKGTSWRWMGAAGQIVLPSLSGPGTLTVRGRAPVELLGQPPLLSFTAGTRPLGSRPLTAATFVESFRIEPADFGGKPHMDVVVTVSATAKAPGDSRALGIAVESVEWDPVR